MDASVRIPVFGQVKKRTALVGGGIVLAVFGILWWRRHQAASSAGSAAAAQIDPQTGLPAGSPQDQAALAQQGAFGGAGSVPVGSGPPAASGPPGPGSFTTNADWAQYAENYLTASVGLPPATVGAAIGRYIGGLPLTPDQIGIVTQAIAFAGLPPVAGHGGNPPGYLTAPPPPPPHRKPGPHRTITADGHSDVQDLANDNGDTEAQVIAWNPGLRRYVGTGKPVPAGTKVRV